MKTNYLQFCPFLELSMHKNVNQPVVSWLHWAVSSLHLHLTNASLDSSHQINQFNLVQHISLTEMRKLNIFPEFHRDFGLSCSHLSPGSLPLTPCGINMD